MCVCVRETPLSQQLSYNHHPLTYRFDSSFHPFLQEPCLFRKVCHENQLNDILTHLICIRFRHALQNILCLRVGRNTYVYCNV
jgi:hypothetical protein